MHRIISASQLSVVFDIFETWLRARRGLQAFALLVPSGKHRPAVIHRWREDVEFARQRPDGINPTMIHRVTAGLKNFPVTDALVAGILDEGERLAGARKAGRLYVCDYAILRGIAVKAGRVLTQPIVLYYVGGDQQLRPVAIPLHQTPDDGPILPRTIRPAPGCGQDLCAIGGCPGA